MVVRAPRSALHSFDSSLRIFHARSRSTGTVPDGNPGAYALANSEPDSFSVTGSCTDSVTEPRAFADTLTDAEPDSIAYACPYDRMGRGLAQADGRRR